MGVVASVEDMTWYEIGWPCGAAKTVTAQRERRDRADGKIILDGVREGNRASNEENRRERGSRGEKRRQREKA